MNGFQSWFSVAGKMLKFYFKIGNLALGTMEKWEFLWVFSFGIKRAKNAEKNYENGRKCAFPEKFSAFLLIFPNIRSFHRLLSLFSIFLCNFVVVSNSHKKVRQID